MFLDFSRDQLQPIQAPNQESNPKHKPKNFGQKILSPFSFALNPKNVKIALLLS